MTHLWRVVRSSRWRGATVLTLWAANDPGSLGRCETQQELVESVPGAVGQPHDRPDEAFHFLQGDQGEEIARRMVDWYASLRRETAE